MKKKIIITGATGTIGRKLCSKFFQKKINNNLFFEIAKEKFKQKNPSLIKTGLINFMYLTVISKAAFFWFA